MSINSLFVPLESPLFTLRVSCQSIFSVILHLFSNIICLLVLSAVEGERGDVWEVFLSRF